MDIPLYEMGPNEFNILHAIGTIDEEIIAEAKSANIPLRD